MNNTTKRKIIIDTDAGLDDAQAILMALSSADVEVVAITTVMGNTLARQSAKNVLRILKLDNRLEVPVFVGCEKALNGYIVEGCQGYHGHDGFGDCPDPEAPDPSLIKDEDGISALIRLSKQHEGELTLVCIGPLTNIATAVNQDSEFGKRLKYCYIMGGNYYGKGNMTMSSEYNFYVDPEAAREVLQKLQCPKYILGWEICLDNAFSWEWYSDFWKTDSSKTKYLEKLEQYPLQKYYIPSREKDISHEYQFADQFIMAAMLDSRVILESKTLYVDVETKGELTRGQMVVDWLNMSKKDPNVTIITKVDKNLVDSILRKAMH